TIIRPKTTERRPIMKGGPFCLWDDDWTFMPGRIKKMNELKDDGFSIGIISNQAFKDAEIVKARIKNICRTLNQYIKGIVICWCVDKDSEYRKPNNGWNKCIKCGNGSFYCGDAVQDNENKHRSWGYNDSDREFAKNMRLRFYSPEEIFENKMIEIDEDVKCLILVGPQGSGKSTFAKNMNGFIHIESDKYRSRWKNIAIEIAKFLKAGRRVIVDATNPSRKRRLQILDIANCKCAIVLFVNAGKWNGIRENPVADIALRLYWSKYEEPESRLEKNVIVYEYCG
ncbi:MAG: AAA family ATPase, partial [Acidimicrobiales bacterium]